MKICILLLCVAIIADNVAIYYLQKQISTLVKLLGWIEDEE